MASPLALRHISSPHKPEVKVCTSSCHQSVLYSWSCKVRVRTLGRFLIEVDGQPVEFSRKVQRRPLALLKGLIAYGGYEIPKTHLSDVLWPDADGDQAHQSFATTLHRLRKLLGCEKAVLLKDGKVSLNPQLCWIDVWTFEDCVGKARQRGIQKNFKLVREQCEQYLTLYTGEFLSEDIHEDWTYHLRERLRGGFIRDCCRLAEDLVAMGKAKHAVAFLEQAIDRESAAEPLYQALADALRSLKRETEAQSVIEQFQHLTRHSIGITAIAPTLHLVSNFTRKS